MARVTHVKKAQQRYKMVPVVDPATGEQKVVAVTKKDGSPKLTKNGRAITRKLTVEDRNQPLPNRNCSRCGTEIKVGDPYKWLALNTGYGSTRKNYCTSCTPRQSDMTSSDKLSQLYAAQENVEDALDADGWTRDDIAQALRDAGEQAQGVAEEYTESADNIEEGFGHETQMSEEIREKAESCEEWSSVLDAAADEVESADDPDDDESLREDNEGNFDNEEELADAIEEERERRREAIRELATDAIYELML